MKLSGDGYLARISGGVGQELARDSASGPDPDILSEFANGDHFILTLYTPERIAVLINDELHRFRRDGAYFWDPSFVIVRDYKQETVAATIDDLVRTGLYKKVCQPSTSGRSGPVDT